MIAISAIGGMLSAAAIGWLLRVITSSASDSSLSSSAETLAGILISFGIFDALERRNMKP